MLCKKCFKYHNLNKLCKKAIVKCCNCNHLQKTLNSNVVTVKCGVCNQYKMKVYKNG